MDFCSDLNGKAIMWKTSATIMCIFLMLFSFLFLNFFETITLGTTKENV